MGSEEHIPAPEEGQGGLGALCQRKGRWAVNCGPQSLGGSGLVLPGELLWKEAHLGTQKEH